MCVRGVFFLPLFDPNLCQSKKKKKSFAMLFPSVHLSFRRSFALSLNDMVLNLMLICYVLCFPSNHTGHYNTYTLHTSPMHFHLANLINTSFIYSFIYRFYTQLFSIFPKPKIPRNWIEIAIYSSAHKFDFTQSTKHNNKNTVYYWIRAVYKQSNIHSDCNLDAKIVEGFNLINQASCWTQSGERKIIIEIVLVVDATSGFNACSTSCNHILLLLGKLLMFWPWWNCKTW